MAELLRRLFNNPFIGFELVLATLFANLLALATPVFVIQVLNRYVAFGVDATLATLGVGAVIAVFFEMGFRRARLQLAEQASKPFDQSLANVGLTALTRSPLAIATLFSNKARHHAASGSDQVRQAYGPVNMLVFIDAPFSLLFIGVLFLLSAHLALVTIVFCLLALLLPLASWLALRGVYRDLSETTSARTELAQSALHSGETVRLFDNGGRVSQKWRDLQATMSALLETITSRQDLLQNGTQVLQTLLTISIISIGAYLVVRGYLDVGVLIGANILAARALIPLVKVGSTIRSLVQAEDAQHMLGELVRVPVERTQGSTLALYKGGVSFDDASFIYHGQQTPLFESLNFELNPGQTLAVIGPNGSGKTTIAQIIAGIRAPVRGRVMVDGIDLAQVLPEWWHRQISYLPQEPRFLPGTIRENLLAVDPELDDKKMTQLIEQAALRRFIAESPDGLDMTLRNSGTELAVGIRRRLSLARALATNGRLLIVDEPTEGLDSDGCNMMYAAMNRHAESGGTIIACSTDSNIIKGADWVIDLAIKPKPEVRRLRKPGAKTGTKKVSTND